jgi:hypothetical protein
MTTFLQPDEAGIESRTKRGQNKRGQNRAACFLHLRDLVYLHPKAAGRRHCVRAVARSGGDR